MKSMKLASLGMKRDTPYSLISCDDSPNPVYKHSTTTPTRTKNGGGSPIGRVSRRVLRIYIYILSTRVRGYTRIY